jgi:branched-chain amino acid transport system substrate-binding protein
MYQDDDFGSPEGRRSRPETIGMDFTEKNFVQRGATDFSSQISKMQASG